MKTLEQLRKEMEVAWVAAYDAAWIAHVDANTANCAIRDAAYTVAFAALAAHNNAEKLQTEN